MPRAAGSAAEGRPPRLAPTLVGAAAALAAVLLASPAGSAGDEPAGLPSIYDLSRHAPPDDSVLAEQLDGAIELRRREDFDRVLDARDPGELIEHATLTDVDFDHRSLDIDTLFIVGDELFGYAFRPENGWGNDDSRNASDTTPRLRRVHRGDEGGPDAFGCFGCHFKGGPDGAGTQTQTAFLRGDADSIESADERNPPHLLGLGAVELLAREMSRELRAQADAAAAQARQSGARVERALSAKGVSFGVVTALEGGTLDTSAVEGVDADLVVRPFGWKGHQATLRDMVEESLHIHQGLLSSRVQLARRDGGSGYSVYGDGPWYDVDEDGVSLEIDSGMLSTVVGYLAQLEAPVVRPPRDSTLVDAFAAGRTTFDRIGCATCHVPVLELDDTELVVREATASSEPFVIDVAHDGDGPKIEPKYAGPKTSYLVRLFSDLRRHDMGEALATPADQGEISARQFLTRPLWGLAESAPYLHDGRAPTVGDAIALHGGEAAAARDAYLELPDAARAELRVFLASLSRQPKLFVP